MKLIIALRILILIGSMTLMAGCASDTDQQAASVDPNFPPAPLTPESSSTP